MAEMQNVMPKHLPLQTLRAPGAGFSARSTLYANPETMNKIKLTLNGAGGLSSTSRDQIRSLIKSTGGIFGERLAAVVLPKIEREIQRHVAAHSRPIRFMRVADFHAKTVGSPLSGLADGFSTLTPGMTMRPVESSSLRRVGYSQASRTLRIEFKEGSVWDYLQVPPSEYEGLMKAGSHGRYFYSHIRNRFQSRKIL